MAEFTSGYVQDNEVVKAEDINFGFDSQIDNVSRALQMIFECKQDFVVGGRVIPYSSRKLNVSIEPLFGVCFKTGKCFGNTELIGPVAISQPDKERRIDIIQLKGDFELYDEQQRAFSDFETDIRTYKDTFTKKKLTIDRKNLVKKGVPGSATAPKVDDGYVKIAEIVVEPSTINIEEGNIKNITSDVSGLENTEWTNQKTITYNVGYISQVNNRFRKEHNEDGTHKRKIIGQDELNYGTGDKQISGSILPTGLQIKVNDDEPKGIEYSIANNINNLAKKITDLFIPYLKYGKFNFNGEVSISNLVTENILTKALKMGAKGDGTAYFKVGNKELFTLTTEGTIRMSTGFKAINGLDLVNKAVTDVLSGEINTVKNQINDIYSKLDNSTYVNDLFGRFTKTIKVEAATTINNNLQGEQIIDGVSLLDTYIVLVKNQSNKKQNGIYEVKKGSWIRKSGYDTAEGLKHKFYLVQNGDTNKAKLFYIPLENFKVGTNDISFTEYDKIETQQLEDGAVTAIKIGDKKNTTNSLLSSLSAGSADIENDETTVICQDTGLSNTYFRRPIKFFWNWIKSKISSVLGLTATQYNGNAKTSSSCTGNAATSSSCTGNAATSTNATNHIARKDNPHGITTSQIHAVPDSRKVNNHPLSSDVTVTKDDVGLGNVSNYSFETIWTKIKENISSVLGLTKENYSGTASKATNDSSNHHIANTYMPRGINFKNGLIKDLRGETNNEYSWTATEDCFMIFSGYSNSAKRGYLKVDDVLVADGSADSSKWCINPTVSIPIKKGQTVAFKSTWAADFGQRYVGDIGAKFYKYYY